MKKRTLEEQRFIIYRERNRNVRAIGYKSYPAYLKSQLWAGIRAAVLSQHPGCVRCGKPANQVHHRRYRKTDLEGRDLRSLFAVCAACHKWCEFRDRGAEKLTPKQATTKLLFHGKSRK